MKLALSILVTMTCLAQTVGADVMPPSADAAVSRGIDFLSGIQNPDGSFGAKQKPAITGLALLSFLGSGQTADVGRHGPIVRAAIDFLLSSAQPDGAFNREKDEKPMFGQAIATLALAQAYGVEQSEAHRRKIAGAVFRSVPLILKAQNVKKPDSFAGGWGYTPDAQDSDLSLSAWNAMALRAAQDVGVRVPADAAKRAGEFVLKCYDPQNKGFGYQQKSPSATSATAMAVACLQILDDQKTNFSTRREARDGIRYLEKNPLKDDAQYWYHDIYFMTFAAWRAGDSTFAAAGEQSLARVLKLQQADGGWPESKEAPSRAYTSSMSLLTLTIPYQLLPIYRR